MALHYSATDPNGEGLVWDSEVSVTIDPPDDKRSSAVDPFASKASSIISYADSSTNSLSRCAPHQQTYRSTTAFSTGADADDEGSIRISSPTLTKKAHDLIEARRRTRTYSKQLRRRALNISRDDLRISSNWSSGEKKSMENFRNAIRFKAANATNSGQGLERTLRTNERSIITEAKIFSKKVAQGLRDGINKSTGRGRSPATVTESTAPLLSMLPREEIYDKSRLDVPKPEAITTSSTSSIPSKPALPSSLPFRHTQHPPSLRSTTNPHAKHPRLSSWQTHLQTDLSYSSNRSPRSKKSTYHPQFRFMESSQQPNIPNHNLNHAILPSNYFSFSTYESPIYHDARYDSAIESLCMDYDPSVAKSPPEQMEEILAAEEDVTSEFEMDDDYDARMVKHLRITVV